jgi:tetratricopeptide (TPR) repeat protein
MASTVDRTMRVVSWVFSRLPTLLLVILLAPAVFFVFTEGRRYSVIVDDISVPKSFDDVGLTSEVVAGRVAAAMQQIELRTHARLENDSMAPAGIASMQNSGMLAIEMPGTHLSLKVLSELAQTMFGHASSHVSGDIVITTEKHSNGQEVGSEVIITVRVQRAGHPFESHTAVVHTDNVEVLAYRAAALALQSLNPYILAADDRERGDLQGALTLINQLVQDPGQDDKHQLATYILWARTLTDQREYGKAEKKYQTAEQWGARDPKLYVNWGVTLFATRQQDALEKYAHALQFDRNSPDAYNSRGAAEWRMNEEPQALADYLKAIDVDPKHCYANAYNNLGVLYRKRKDTEQAVGNFRRAIDCDPTLIMAYKNWADLEASQRHFDIADHIWSEAIQTDPRSSSAYYEWAVLEGKQTRVDLAMSNFQHAIDLDPSESKYYSGLADLLYDNGQFADAARQYWRAIALYERDPKYHNNLGNTLRALGRCQEAEAEYNRSSALNPQWSTPIHNAGFVLVMRGRLESALEQFQTAAKFDSLDAVALQGEGKVFAARKQWDLAAAQYQAAIAIDGRDYRSYEELASILRLQGKTQAAAKVLADFGEPGEKPSGNGSRLPHANEATRCGA